MISATSVKLVSVAAVSLVSLLGGTLPLMLPPRTHHAMRDKVLAHGNMAAAGFFLCVGLVHLLSEATEGIEKGFEPGTGPDFAVANVIAAGAFFLLLLIEETAMWWGARAARRVHDAHTHGDDGHHTHIAPGDSTLSTPLLDDAKGPHYIQSYQSPDVTVECTVPTVTEATTVDTNDTVNNNNSNSNNINDEGIVCEDLCEDVIRDNIITALVPRSALFSQRSMSIPSATGITDADIEAAFMAVENGPGRIGNPPANTGSKIYNVNSNSSISNINSNAKYSNHSINGADDYGYVTFDGPDDDDVGDDGERNEAADPQRKKRCKRHGAQRKRAKAARSNSAVGENAGAVPKKGKEVSAEMGMESGALASVFAGSMSPDHTHSNLPKLSSHLLFLALSTHAMLAGLSLGTQTEAKGAFQLLLAIASHKPLEAFSLGGGLARLGFADSVVVGVVCVFSAVTPVGIGIGIGISAAVGHSTTTLDVVSGVLSACAAGAFLFVACIEVIPAEMADKTGRFTKLIALVTGFGIMLGALVLCAE